MLALSRKLEESIIIGDDIIIKVKGIKGDRVSIGIEAPRDARIRRAEIPNHLSKNDKDASECSKRP